MKIDTLKICDAIATLVIVVAMAITTAPYFVQTKQEPMNAYQKLEAACKNTGMFASNTDKALCYLVNTYGAQRAMQMIIHMDD